MTNPKYLYAGWAEAFAIFHHYTNHNFDHVACEHDIIYAGPDPTAVSEQHKARLEELGWYADHSLDCFYRFV